jgi:hypothetical protein
VIVLLVGTNNHGDTPDDIAEGIKGICTLIRDKQPQAYLVVLTLLPRGNYILFTSCLHLVYILFTSCLHLVYIALTLLFTSWPGRGLHDYISLTSCLHLVYTFTFCLGHSPNKLRERNAAVNALVAEQLKGNSR